MKAIILCAGYATRLYPLTLNKPKALLPINNIPIISHIVKKIEEIKEIDEIYVVTNSKFYKSFVEWKNSLKTNKKIIIVNDKTKSNEDRLGGIGDLWFTIQKEKINDDILLLLGDNLFDFNIKEFVEYYEKKNNTTIGAYKINNFSDKQKFGIVSVNNGNKVIPIEDKYPTKNSNTISIGIYLLSKNDIDRIKEYMKTEKPKEGPGFLIIDWAKTKDIYSYNFEGKWFDIGSKESYEKIKDNWN